MMARAGLKVVPLGHGWGIVAPAGQKWLAMHATHPVAPGLDM